MGKNQSASNLTNIIKQDGSGNIVFTSGSTTLATISTTGQLSGSTPALSASYAATSSYATNFNVSGTITATTLVVQTITSSVDFVTGSTRFGSLIGNTHVFTGSVSITGSLAVVTNGTEFQVGATGVTLGNVVTDTHNITGSVNVSGSATFLNNVSITAGGDNLTLVRPGFTSWQLGIGTANSINGLHFGSGGTTYLTLQQSTGAVSTASELVIGSPAGLNLGGYNFYGQTISGVMGIIGHNVRPSTTNSNTVNVVNSGWYSSMIKIYYNDGITFHTSLTVYNAGDVYPMSTTERMRILSAGDIEMQGSNSSAKFKFWRIYSNSQPGFSMYNTSGTEILYFNGNTGGLGVVQAGNTFTSGFITQNTSGNTWGVVAGGDNNFYIGFNASSRGYFSSSTGNYVAVSDINKKKDFEESTIGLDAVLGLKPTLFRMKDEEENTEKHLGFIAQEVKDYIPQAYTETGEGENKFIGLADRPIIAALTKAIQELNTKLDAANAEIEALKNK